MLFDIHPDASIPIYEQIVSQLIFGIASGAVEPGATIPSIRELADKLIVNPNTVARAVQELERRGVVASKRGVGMEVTEAAPDLCRTERKDIIRRRIREALQEAASSALSPDDIRRIVDDELAKANGHRRSKERH
jgi:GntR family transcriptional regulator